VTATVGVLGPGAVGGALAVRLAQAGVDVVCIARPETAAAIAQDGLTLEAAGRTLRSQPEAVERLAKPVDLLFVTVKAPHLDAALDRVEAPAGAVLPLLNGLEHVAAIRTRLGRRVAPGSISRFEAYRDGPTRIVQTTTSGEVTMASDDLPRADLERAAELLERAGFETAVGTSEKAVLWEKAARLAVLSAATALTDRPVAELATDQEWRPVLVAAIAEACAVAAADGAPLATEAQWAIIDAMPGTLTTSTARDVAAGRASELDAITGAVVRAGRRLGVPTPTLDQLLAIASS
jgi:2-dehydropantoate 2-reductase